MPVRTASGTAEASLAAEPTSTAETSSLLGGGGIVGVSEQQSLAATFTEFVPLAETTSAAVVSALEFGLLHRHGTPSRSYPHSSFWWTIGDELPAVLESWCYVSDVQQTDAFRAYVAAHQEVFRKDGQVRTGIPDELLRSVPNDAPPSLDVPTGVLPPLDVTRAAALAVAPSSAPSLSPEAAAAAPVPVPKTRSSGPVTLHVYDSVEVNDGSNIYNVGDRVTLAKLASWVGTVRRFWRVGDVIHYDVDFDGEGVRPTAAARALGYPESALRPFVERRRRAAPQVMLLRLMYLASAAAPPRTLLHSAD